MIKIPGIEGPQKKEEKKPKTPVQKNYIEKYVRRKNLEKMREGKERSAKRVEENLEEEVIEFWNMQMEHVTRYVEEDDMPLEEALLLRTEKILGTTELDDDTKEVYGERNKVVLEAMLDMASKNEASPEKVEELRDRLEQLYSEDS